jgi:hypothetical protein
MEGNGYGLIEAVCLHLHIRTQETPAKTQENQYSSRDSKGVPLEYKSRVLPLHQPAQ